MLIIIGKSGSGKSTVVNELLHHGYRKIITDTTRPPRAGEVDGVDYNFLSQDEFDANKATGLYAEDVSYDASFGRCCYGSRKESYENGSDKDVIILNPYGLKMVVENVGVDSITSIYLKLDDELILDRLSQRGDANEEVARRLETDRVDFCNIENVVTYTVSVSADDSVEKVAETIKWLIEP